MKMKRLLALFLAFMMCFMLAACQKDTVQEETSAKDNTQATKNTETPQVSVSKPLLYRVTAKNGNVVWLFGSIHVGRKDYYPLPDYVMNAFENADSLAVEVDIVAFEKNLGAQLKALTHLVYTDETTIKDHIPQELYDRSVAILKQYNYYRSELDYYCPAFWGSAIESLMAEEMGADSDLGIDRYLIKQANSAKKEIVDIESAEFQYKMMGDFDAELQEMLLASAVVSHENPEQAKADLEKLMDLWASGDEEAFNAYLNAVDPAMTAEEKAAYERYNKTMITDRNINMADYAESALASGKEMFICVGAAHIVGDGAMAELLTQRGYTVELIRE